MLGHDALIMTLTGPRLAGDLLNQGSVRVLTWDGDRVTVGEIVVSDGPMLTIPYRLILDDGAELVFCKETMLLLRNGAPRYPEQLAPKTSLLPLYSKFDSSGYSIYQEPGDWHKNALTPSDRYRWRRVSRLVAEWKLERRCGPEDTVSFVSDDRTDCRPDNLIVTQKKRKKSEVKVKFAEPIFAAQRFIKKHNHKVISIYLDASRNLLSIRGLRTANIAVSGIFASVDSE